MSGDDAKPKGLSQGISKTWTFFEGDWHEGNVPIMGTRSHAALFSSSGAFIAAARSMERKTLDRLLAHHFDIW